ncbi:TIGR03364 family FAD-dependent oxidoreductase [Gryllotalpicola sp.]|uniref:TIGR03364 family FAD-dependent oxidoreductase n=1 Tax=Gryllotalpicola sp. TaxID=1932787 RepID=UPI0026030D0F|nr:TIGR03364 family FAD-dependent oxidoreductase [Gryllotalpicola sp.]
MTTAAPTDRYDLAVVGAGIVGLAHAWHAARGGLRVVVLERDEFAAGASIRNFGHICTTAQNGTALDYALRARSEWLTLGAAAGFPVAEAGTVVVARTSAELAVLEEFAPQRDGHVALLTAAEVAERAGFDAPDAVGGAHFALDLRLNSPSAVPALTAHLETLGVEFRFGVNVQRVEPGIVLTSSGEIVAERTVVCVGHDVDRFFPELASAVGIRRCRLRMMEIDAPGGIQVAPGILTGTSLLRYDGPASTGAAEALRAEVAETAPELVENAVNLMFTQRPHGSLVIGDTHHYGITESPFEDEAVDELLLREFSRLLGADSLRVRRRWRGIYASSAAQDFLVEQPVPGVSVVSVTTGIGMTCALGLAATTLALAAA